MTSAALYRIEHETRYAYAASVSTSQHVAYLRPRDLPRQTVHRHTLDVTPTPAQATRREDYFGNAVEQFSVLKPHAELVALARTVVEVRGRDEGVDPTASPAWEEARDGLVYVKGVHAGEAAQYAYTSPFIAPSAELADFARASFAPGRPLLEASLDLMHRIHAEFRFDPSATNVTTPLRRVLEEKKGVCQDFAHLQIAGLRSLGLSARYVSGYLLTDPPPGQRRLVGADASHAWLSVHCPRNGWVDLDPTNDVLPDLRHVTLAWGRDYGDVSPLRGVILGGAAHTLHVGVSVVPIETTESGAA
jgi:transglutaminase-like putative cysteine protease